MTPEQIKKRFRLRGQTISGWARQNGYQPSKVIRVLNGFDKGNYGKAHEIAVALGLKPNTQSNQTQSNATILAEAGRGAKNVAAA